MVYCSNISRVSSHPLNMVADGPSANTCRDSAIMIDDVYTYSYKTLTHIVCMCVYVLVCVCMYVDTWWLNHDKRTLILCFGVFGLKILGQLIYWGTQLCRIAIINSGKINKVAVYQKSICYLGESWRRVSASVPEAYDHRWLISSNVRARDPWSLNWLRNNVVSL